MAKNCYDCKQERSLAAETVKKSELHARRWFAAWLITFILFLGLIGGILYFVLTSEIEIVTQDGSGINNYIGNDGDINNGPTSN